MAMATELMACSGSGRDSNGDMMNRAGNLSISTIIIMMIVIIISVIGNDTDPHSETLWNIALIRLDKLI